MEKSTLVIGASLNPMRYSHKAIILLQSMGFNHIALGLKSGKIGSTEIATEYKHIDGLDTVSLYVGPKNQDKALVDYIISLAPRRVIFNPGSESIETSTALIKAGINIEMACTLVLLRTNQY